MKKFTNPIRVHLYKFQTSSGKKKRDFETFKTIILNSIGAGL
nr:MAG TPA: hypothetical protein [Caudoviricetes sp.]